MTADDSTKSQCAHSGMKSQVGGFQNPEESFLPSPPPPPSFTRAIFRAVILCSWTPQKRLLRKLVEQQITFSSSRANISPQRFNWRIPHFSKRYQYTVGLHWFKLGYSEFPVSSNSISLALDLSFSHILSAISNSRYLELFLVSPESLKLRGSNVHWTIPYAER